MARPRSIQIDPVVLKQLYVSDNLSLAEIAARMGVSAESVRHRLKECGIESHAPHRRFGVTESQYAEVVRLYEEEKLGLVDIAERMGVPYCTLRNAAIRAGIKLDEPGRQRRGPYQARRHYARRTTSMGYQTEYCPNHPRAKKRGQYVATHVLVVESFIGRYLVPGEVVHHINMHKADNRVENLAVLNNSTHAKVHEYMEHCAVFLCKLSPIRPEPLDFGEPVFWGGKYVTCIDLLQGASFASGEPLLDEKPLGKSFKEMLN